MIKRVDVSYFQKNAVTGNIPKNLYAAIRTCRYDFRRPPRREDSMISPSCGVTNLTLMECALVHVSCRQGEVIFLPLYKENCSNKFPNCFDNHVFLLRAPQVICFSLYSRAGRQRRPLLACIFRRFQFQIMGHEVYFQ